jgi:hypothetical protein
MCPLCWQHFGWQKKQYYQILAATKMWSNCLKLCRSRSQGPLAVCYLYLLPDSVLRLVLKYLCVFENGILGLDFGLCLVQAFSCPVWRLIFRRFCLKEDKGFGIPSNV